MLYGVDISQYQESPDFDQLKNDPHGQFCIARANFGSPDNASVLNEDPQFGRNKSEMRRVGMLRGFYHYAYPQYNSPEAEADFFASISSDIQQGEILELDLEEKIADPVGWALAWLNRVSSHFNGYKPLLYTYLSYLSGHDWSPILNAGYGIHLAAYDGNTDQSFPSVIWPFLAFKQYADNGHVAGINTSVDLDVFYGDATAFQKYGYQALAPAPQPTPAPSPAPQPDPRDAEIATLQANVTNLTNENNSLQKQVSDLTAANTQLQNNLTVADNTINKDDLQIKDDAQTIADLRTNVAELTAKVADYDSNTIPNLEKQVTNLQAQIATLTTATNNLGKPSPILTTPVVNDPNMPFWQMEVGQALKTLGGFITWEMNRIFHKK